MLKSSFIPFSGPYENVIDLREGALSNDVLVTSSQLICRASSLTTEECKSSPDVFAYCDSRGSEVTRKYFASFLSKQYNDEVSKDNLFVTNGATVALQHILTPLFFPRSHVKIFSPEPYYPLAIDIFKNDLHCNVDYVVSSNAVCDLEDLEAKLKEQYSLYQSNKTPEEYFSCCLYLVPAYNNPLGISYTPEHCEALVDLAHKYKTLIICDDVYNLLVYNGEAPKRLMAYDYKYEDGCVISNGSFSKFLMPSIRVGWLEANKKLIDRIAEMNILFAGGCINQYSSLVIAHAIKSGELDVHLKHVIAILKERAEVMQRTLDENLPEGCTFDKIDGGYFIWLRLPGHVDTGRLTEVIFDKHKVIIMPGKVFCSSNQYNHCIRISFSRPNGLIDIEKGCRLLCETIREFL